MGGEEGGGEGQEIKIPLVILIMINKDLTLHESSKRRLTQCTNSIKQR